MYYSTKSLALAGTTLVLLALSAPAHAQATRTWVSGVGDDFNPCSRTAPCKTFAGAISKTFINGEIDCLDPGGYGAVTITKSITLDCTGTFGSILTGASSGIVINIPVSANDPLRTVRIRGLSINGAGASGTIGTRVGLKGINIVQASAVTIEDTVISEFSQQGIVDARATGGKLFVRNSVIRDNTLAGIVVASTSGSTASIENVHSLNNGQGLATANLNKVSVVRSVFAGNTAAGIESDAGGQVGVDSTVATANNIGLQNSGTMSVSNSEISLNATGASGAFTSFGNNRIFGNTLAGTAPTVGAPSSAHGEQ